MCIRDRDNTYGNLSYSFKTFVRKDNCKTVSHAYSDPVSGHNAVDNPSHYCGTKYQVINFIEDWGDVYKRQVKVSVLLNDTVPSLQSRKV